jgi:hypothetical protein
MDITGGRQPDRPSGMVPLPAQIDPQDWLGDYTGTCGEWECSLSLTEEEEGGLTAQLQEEGGEPLRLSGIRINGNRGRGAKEDASTRTVLELQMRDGMLFGIWTNRDQNGEVLLEIRFVGRGGEARAGR